MKRFNLSSFLIIGVAVAWLSGIAISDLKAQSPDTSFNLFTRIDGEYKFFTTDKLQQIYLVTMTNEVIKFSPEGREIFRFNNNTLGDLAFIDATNPFNLLLFYPDFQTAITLDRTMNMINEVNLINLGIINVQALGASNDNNFWLYDELNFQLKKMDRRGSVLNVSEDLNLLLGNAPQPIYIEARENFVYLNAPSMGIMVFDNFGQYHKTLPLTDVDYFQVLDHRLIYLQKEVYYAYDSKTLVTATLQLPAKAKPGHQIRFQKNMCFLLLEDGLEVYRF